MTRGTLVWLSLVAGLGSASACSLAIDLSNITGGQAGQSSTPGGGGGAGGAGGGGLEGGTGGDVGPTGCQSLTECPIPVNPCEYRVCLGNECGTMPMASGTVLPEQTPGDCRLSVCDAQGTVLEQADVTDLPNDDNDCTEDGCTGDGVPSFVTLPLGAWCGPQSAQKCNGAAASPACVDCLLASDCLGQDDDCQWRVCTAGQCQTAHANLGTLVPQQVSGDCKRAVCDGQGSTTTEADDADLPADGNSCTEDRCTSGTPSNTALEGADCGLPGDVCNELGQCVGCNLSSDCGVDSHCASWTCAVDTCIQDYADPGFVLPADHQVVDDCLEVQCDGQGYEMTVPASDGPASDGEECTVDHCVNGTAQFSALPLGAACTQNGGRVCDGLGACVGCNSPSDCDDPGVCRILSCLSNQCAVANVEAGTAAPSSEQTTRDCQLVVCDGQGGTTILADPTDLPIDDNPCTTDYCDGPDPMHAFSGPGSPCLGHDVCDGQGQCVECLYDSHCLAEEWCQQPDRLCVADRAQGAPCGRAEQCSPPNCVDGVCCDTTCTGLCYACSADKTWDADGTCTNVRYGTDPDGECTDPEMCGTGVCCIPFLRRLGLTAVAAGGPYKMCAD